MQLEQHLQAMLQLHLSVRLILEALRYYHDHKKEIKRYVLLPCLQYTQHEQCVAEAY